MSNIKAKLKTGIEIELDFKSYTYKSYTFNNITIKLGSRLIDGFSEVYSVDKILIDVIILRDAENNFYSFPKEDLFDFTKIEE